MDEDLTPAEKLKAVLALMEEGDPRAKKVFRDIDISIPGSAISAI